MEALTVFWMLTTLATLLAEAAALAVWLWAPAAREGGTATLLSLFPRAMFFTALVTGTLSLSLTLLARRLRCEPPPRSITWTAVAIGASPWLLLAWQSMFPQ